MDALKHKSNKFLHSIRLILQWGQRQHWFVTYRQKSLASRQNRTTMNIYLSTFAFTKNDITTHKALVQIKEKINPLSKVSEKLITTLHIQNSKPPSSPNCSRDSKSFIHPSLWSKHVRSSSPNTHIESSCFNSQRTQQHFQYQSC